MKTFKPYKFLCANVKDDLETGRKHIKKTGRAFRKLAHRSAKRKLNKFFDKFKKH